MLDRTHRFRRAGTAAAIAIAVVALASCGDSTGPNNKQNALRPAGPVRAPDPAPDRAVLLDRGRHRRRRGRRHDLRRAALPREAGRGARGRSRSTATRCSRSAGRSSRADPRGHGRADRRHDLQPRQEADRARTSCTSPSPRGSGGGSSRTPTRATASRPRTRCTSRSASRSRSRCRAADVLADAVLPERRDPLVLGPGAERQEGRRARPQAVPEARGRQARRLPGPVRGVLRPLARRHAPAGDRRRRRPTTRRGCSSQHAQTVSEAALKAGVEQRDVRLRDVPQLQVGTSPARWPRTSRTSPTGPRSPATCTS